MSEAVFEDKIDNKTGANAPDGLDDVTGETALQHAMRLSDQKAIQNLETNLGYQGDTGLVVITPGSTRVGRPNAPVVVSQPVTVTKAQAKAQFEGGLLTGDANALAIANWMAQAGLITKAPGTSDFAAIKQATKVYNQAVDLAAATYAVGDVRRSVMDFLSMVPGSSGGGGGGGTSISKQITSYTPEQARQKAIDAYKAILNRTPTDQEVAEFSNALMTSAKNAPTVQKVSRKGGATVQETTQGFNEKDWTLGFMAGKIPADGDLAGASGVAQDTLRSMSENYGIKLSSSLAYDLVRDLVTGKIDENAAEQVFKEQAKIMFPGIADKIDAGLSPRKIADPFISNTMRILEKGATEVDMFNPYVKEALAYKDANGAYVLPTADEHARMLRGKSEWLNTRNAKESLMSTADNILKQMGFE